MVRPGIELEPGIGLGDELGELAGRMGRPCAAGWSVPRAEVSPIAICAFEFPALSPA